MRSALDRTDDRGRRLTGVSLLDAAKGGNDMKRPERTMRARYMEWAKTRSRARFNLAISGVVSVPIAEFPLGSGELELTGPGGYGYAPLLERLASHAGVSTDCIVPAFGTSMANHVAMAAIIQPGDEVLIEQPVYGPLLDVASYLGARVKRIAGRAEDGFALDPAELAEAVTSETRLIILTNLHNPTSAAIPEETLRTIGEMAQRVGARVLVDEAYRELSLMGVFHRRSQWAATRR